MSIMDRTIQRYCHSGKLRAVCVDPDARQFTDKDNYIFLIDPTSIPERVAQLREKQEFVSPTVVASGRDVARPVATGHDMSEGVAPVEEQPKTEKQSNDEADELAQLREQVMPLEIDKRVRDGLLDQVKNDCKELLGQLQGHVETLTKQSREIGQLETRLELSAPAHSQNQMMTIIHQPSFPINLKCTGKTIQWITMQIIIPNMVYNFTYGGRSRKGV